MKIYIVQNLNYSYYELLYVGTDIIKANEVIKTNQNKKYLYGYIWENGKEIKSDLKEFKDND